MCEEKNFPWTSEIVSRENQKKSVRKNELAFNLRECGLKFVNKSNKILIIFNNEEREHFKLIQGDFVVVVFDLKEVYLVV